MNKENDYINDIAEIRSMMERSSKFLSLSGWSGILAGIYASIGAYVAYAFLGFNPDGFTYLDTSSEILSSDLVSIILLAVLVLCLSVGTAVLFSYLKAQKNEEKIWNATSKRLLKDMSIPLFTGGGLIFVLLSKGLVGLMAPLTLIFYGIALFVAGSYTFNAVKTLGLLQIALGVVSCYFIEYSLLLWGIGFGGLHIVYGAYIYFRYER